MALERTKDELE